MAVTNKNIYGCLLRNTDNHELKSFDMLPKDSEVGQKSQHEKNLGQRWRWYCLHLHLYKFVVIKMGSFCPFLLRFFFTEPANVCCLET